MIPASVGGKKWDVGMNDKTRRLNSEEATFKAFECREMAKRAITPEHRAMLEHMAETWNRIAEDINKQTH